LLAPVVVRTPLVPFPGPGRKLLVKPESLQPTGSFKLRGAYVAISAGGQDARKHGVIAHSSGNHGHAVAYAAALLGVRAVVVVPRTAPKVKTDAIKSYGAELVTVDPTLSARIAATEELVARLGYVPIPPFDDPAIIAGQGTIGLEIAADCPQIDLVVVPVSGGGRSRLPTPWQANSVACGRCPAHNRRRAAGGAGWHATVRAHPRTCDRHHHGDRG
jgi:threonine dehydratase